MKRRTFSASFKAEAVKLVKDQGLSAGKAAKDLGISESARYRHLCSCAVAIASEAMLA